MNVTVTNASAPGYLTVYPDSPTRPTASNLNWIGGQTLANLVEVKLGGNGIVDVYNAAGTVDVIADVEGWVTSPGSPTTPDGLFNPLEPVRVLDTRNGTGGVSHRVAAGETITLTATQPGLGAGAAVLNLTATDATAASYLTVWPHGQKKPTASNLNFGPGQTIANRVQVGLSSDGQVDIYNAAGGVNVVADLNGWFTGTQAAGAGAFRPQSPVRTVDTRSAGGPLGPAASRTVQGRGAGGVPSDATTIVANITVTDTTAPSYLTVYPDGVSRPTASDLNWSRGQTVPNLCVIKLGSDGNFRLYNAAGQTDVIVDVVGWYR